MIIFLYGEDTFRSERKIKELKAKFLEKNKSGLEVVDFLDDSKVSFSKIKESIGSKGLFSEKQLIIFKNFLSLSAKVQNDLVDFLKDSKNLVDDKDAVLIFWEKVNGKKGNKLFDFLEKKCKKQQFELLEGAKLYQWVQNEIKEINSEVSISIKALEKLVFFTGNNLLLLNNEIEKLAAYKNKGEIEEKEINMLVKSKINSNIFETIEAFSIGNKKKAILCLDEQLKNNQDPFYVLSMYVYQVRNLLKIEDALEKTSNRFEIAKITKLHPYVVQKGISQIKTLKPGKLKSIFSKLQEIDAKAKTGKADVKNALEKFIVEG
jgi:DNA polymerase III subunit delta